MTRRQPFFAWLATVILVLAAAFVADRTGPMVQAQEDQQQEEQQEQQSQEQQSQEEEQQATESEALLEYEQNTIEIVEMYGESVVSINVEVQGQRVDPFRNIPDEQLPPFFRQFTPQPQQQPPQQGSGSGFVVNEEGRIITNFHVVRGALQEDSTELRQGASITVVFPTRQNEQVPARVVGANALYDLALLELENPDDLPEEVNPIPIGASDRVRVGQKTIAIGNPFGFESTVTTGIVSAVGRNLPLTEAYIPLIQTDAAINPGNSGGPLLNSNGELIGINTAIYPSLSASGQRSFLGIGFAIPSNLLEQNLEQLAGGGIEDISTRPRLGVAITDVDAYPQAVRDRLNLPDNGVAITMVEPGSAAAEAGLQGSQFDIQVGGTAIPAPGDIIIAVDGEEVTSTGQLQSIIFSKDAGESVELTILRNGEEMTVPVELRVVPDQEEGSQQNGQQDQEEEDNQQQQEEQQQND